MIFYFKFQDGFYNHTTTPFPTLLSEENVSVMVTLITVTKHLLKPEILCATVSTTLPETIAKNASRFSTISYSCKQS